MRRARSTPPAKMTLMSSEYLARTSSVRGEVVLRRREDGVVELRVNGVFVMDTRETGTEQQLAGEALGAVDPTRTDVVVLIGGLGLGYTLGRVLDDERVTSVIVAEIEPGLVAWHRQGLVPSSRLDDARVCVEVGDVRDVVAGLAERSIDVVALDVDNGPGFLVYDANSAVYQAPFLASCRRALRQHGLVAVWSASSSPALTRALVEVYGSCTERRIPVQLAQRTTTYHLFLAAASR